MLRKSHEPSVSIPNLGGPLNPVWLLESTHYSEAVHCRLQGQLSSLQVRRIIKHLQQRAELWNVDFTQYRERSNVISILPTAKDIEWRLVLSASARGMEPAERTSVLDGIVNYHAGQADSHLDHLSEFVITTPIALRQS